MSENDYGMKEVWLTPTGELRIYRYTLPLNSPMMQKVLARRSYIEIVYGYELLGPL